MIVTVTRPIRLVVRDDPTGVSVWNAIETIVPGLVDAEWLRTYMGPSVYELYRTDGVIVEDAPALVTVRLPEDLEP